MNTDEVVFYCFELADRKVNSSSYDVEIIENLTGNECAILLDRLFFTYIFEREWSSSTQLIDDHLPCRAWLVHFHVIFCYVPGRSLSSVIFHTESQSFCICDFIFSSMNQNGYLIGFTFYNLTLSCSWKRNVIIRFLWKMFGFLCCRHKKTKYMEMSKSKMCPMSRKSSSMDSWAPHRGH